MTATSGGAGAAGGGVAVLDKTVATLMSRQITILDWIAKSLVSSTTAGALGAPGLTAAIAGSASALSASQARLAFGESSQAKVVAQMAAQAQQTP